MSGKNQFSTWADDSNSRIVDVIHASKNTALTSSWALEAPDPYSEIEFGYCAHLSSAKSLPEFEHKIDQSIKDLGFQQFSYFRSDGGAGDSEKLVTVSRELIADYFNECFFEHDLILPYVDSNVAPIYQSTLHDYAKNAPFDIGMTQMMKAICGLNKSHGYHDFYNTLAKARSGKGNVVLSVTVQGCSPVELKRIVRGSESTLQLLCEAIDLVASRKFPNSLFGSAKSDEKPKFIINPKPLGVLDTLANKDLNISQVADHLNISVVTANKHLEVARKAFGARTNYAAIKKAIQSGLIAY
jgi:DNA-binding NarL/FixJ family response regulator